MRGEINRRKKANARSIGNLPGYLPWVIDESRDEWPGEIQLTNTCDGRRPEISVLIGEFDLATLHGLVW